MLTGRPVAIRNNPHLAPFVAGAALPSTVVNFIESAPKRKTKEKSRAEEEMQAILEAYLRRGEITSFGYEQITLHVGEDLCRYTPDFHVITKHSHLRFIEVKGGKKWEDSIVKFKAAKKQFPAFDFQMFELTPAKGWKQLY